MELRRSLLVELVFVCLPVFSDGHFSSSNSATYYTVDVNSLQQCTNMCIQSAIMGFNAAGTLARDPTSRKGFQKGLSHDQITCTNEAMIFRGSQENFPRYAAYEIKLGKCPLEGDFSIAANLSSCDITKTIVGDVVTFSGTLKSDEFTGVITRRRPVHMSISCSYNRLTQRTASSSLLPSVTEIVGEIQQSGDEVDLYLNLLDEDGDVVATGADLPVKIGKKIFAEVGGKHMEQFGLHAYATDCFVTPDADRDNSFRHELLRNSCPLDETFKISASGQGQQIEFESFAFTHDQKASLYLHCDLVACDIEAGCGVCAGGRKRRSTKKRMYTVSTVKKILVV